jgi:HEAT repeat protein
MLLQIVYVSLVMIQISAPQLVIETKNEHLRTIDEGLRRHNIAIKQPELLRALKNPDAEVRYLAALKLGELRATDAVPKLLDALNAEKVEVTKVNIGLALAELGSDDGFTALEEGCKNSNWGAQARLQAAEYLDDLRPDRNLCLNSILDLAETAPAGYRIQALSMLPKLQGISPSDRQRAFDIVIKSLSASEPAVRIAASGAAVEIGNEAAIPALQKAIAEEPEKDIRSQIEHDLARLRAKHNL